MAVMFSVVSLALSVSLIIVSALQVTGSALPVTTIRQKLDWSTIGGSIIVVGSFDGLTLPTAASLGVDIANSSTTSSLDSDPGSGWTDGLTRVILQGSLAPFLMTGNTVRSTINDDFTVLATLPSSDHIDQTCVLRSLNSSMAPMLILAGSITVTDPTTLATFTTLVATWDPQKGSLEPLGGRSGLRINPTFNTAATALYCDSRLDTVWVASPLIQGQASKFTDGFWTPALPFNGVNGPIHSILPLPTFERGVLMAGAFTATNDTSRNSANGVPTQIIPFVPRLLNSEDSLSMTSFGCGALNGSGWTVGAGQTSGSLLLNLVRPGVLAQISISNLQGEKRGSSSIIVTSYPDNATLTLAPIDSLGGIGEPCVVCTLQAGSFTQRFAVQGNVNASTSVQINVISSSRNTPGLASILLYDNDLVVFAAQKLNPLQCPSSPKANSVSSAGSAWSEAVNSDGTTALVLEVPKKSLSSSATPENTLTLNPAVPAAGSYDVYYQVPPCGIFDACADRGMAMVKVFTNDPNTPATTVQVNLKSSSWSMVKIYGGRLPSTSAVNSTLPQIVVTPMPKDDNGSGNVTIVAYAIRLYVGASVQGLNGLLSDSVDTNGNVAITSFPGYLTSAPEIRTAMYSGNVLLIGGSFQASGYANLAAYQDGSYSAFPEGGLNGPVTSMLIFKGILYVAGTFSATYTNQTTGLNNIAMLDLRTSRWSSLDGGVAVPNMQLSISAGTSTLYLASSTDGVSVEWAQGKVPAWDINGKFWYSECIASGPLDIVSALDSGNTLISGRIGSFQSVSAVGAAIVSPRGTSPLGTLPLNTKGLGATGALENFKMSTAAIHLDNGVNFTLYAGGQFSLATTPAAANVALFSNETQLWSSPGFSVNGPVSSLKLIKTFNVLLFGGSFTQIKLNNTFSLTAGGFGVWNITSSSIISVPTIENNSTAPSVSKIIYNQDIGIIVIFGNFTAVGSVNCVNLCIWDIGGDKWTSAGDPSSLVGNIEDILFYGPTLVIAGDLTLNGSPSSLAFYQTQQKSFLKPNGVSTYFGGPATHLAIDGLGSLYFAASKSSPNSTMVIRWDNRAYHPLNINPNSTITSLEYLPKNSSTASTDLMADVILIVTGDILVDGVYLSAVIYDLAENSTLPFILVGHASGESGDVSAVVPLVNPPVQVSNPISGSTGASNLSNNLPPWGIALMSVVGGLIAVLVVVGAVYMVRKSEQRSKATNGNKSKIQVVTPNMISSPILPERAATSEPRVLYPTLHKGETPIIQDAETTRAPPTHTSNVFAQGARANVMSGTDLAGVPGRDSVEVAVVDMYRVMHSSPLQSPDIERVTSIQPSVTFADDLSEMQTEPIESMQTRRNSKIGENPHNSIYTLRDENGSNASNRTSREAVCGDSVYVDLGLDQTAAAARAIANLQQDASSPPVPTPISERPPLPNDTMMEAIRLSLTKSRENSPVQSNRASMQVDTSALYIGLNGSPTSPLSPIDGPSFSIAGAAPLPSGSVTFAKSESDHSLKKSLIDNDSVRSGKLIGMDSASATPADVLPTWAYACHTFKPRDPGELGFEAGQRILVIDNSDPLWWMGMVDQGDGSVGPIGVFPTNYVRVENE